MASLRTESISCNIKANFIFNELKQKAISVESKDLLTAKIADSVGERASKTSEWNSFNTASAMIFPGVNVGS